MDRNKLNLDKLADLARIQLPDDLKPDLELELNSILCMLQEMHQLNTNDIQPLAHAIETQQPLRADTSNSQIDREHFQSQAPSTQDHLYTVPQFLEEK